MAKVGGDYGKTKVNKAKGANVGRAGGNGSKGGAPGGDYGEKKADVIKKGAIVNRQGSTGDKRGAFGGDYSAKGSGMKGGNVNRGK
jgi:hypothetical protein